MDTQIIVAALEPWIPIAQQVAAIRAQGDALGVQLQTPSTREAENAIQLVLERQPEFTKDLGLTLGTGVQVFRPIDAAPYLIRDLGTVGAIEAVRILQKVLETRTTAGRIVGLLQGVKVRSHIDFGTGLKIQPFADFPDTSFKRQIEAASGFSASAILGHMVWPETVMIAEIAQVPVMRPLAEAYALMNYADHHFSRMDDATYALSVLPGCAPQLLPIWLELNDVELGSYVKGGFRWSNHFEGPSRHVTAEVGEDAARLIVRFEALDVQSRANLLFALRRLNTAKRSQYAADKAIDTCIALESLLLHQDENDLTQTLVTRSALLSSQQIAGQDCSRIAKELYRLRGKVVHGLSLGTKSKDVTAANLGVELCEHVVRKLIEVGRIPKWKPLSEELMPPEWATQLSSAVPI